MSRNAKNHHSTQNLRRLLLVMLATIGESATTSTTCSDLWKHGHSTIAVKPCLLMVVIMLAVVPVILLVVMPALVHPRHSPSLKKSGEFELAIDSENEEPNKCKAKSKRHVTNESRISAASKKYLGESTTRAARRVHQKSPRKLLPQGLDATAHRGA